MKEAHCTHFIEQGCNNWGAITCRSLATAANNCEVVHDHEYSLYQKLVHGCEL